MVALLFVFGVLFNGTCAVLYAVDGSSGFAAYHGLLTGVLLGVAICSIGEDRSWG